MKTAQAIFLVYSTSHAIYIEKMLAGADIPCKLVPVPRHLSSDCGVCVQIALGDLERAGEVLENTHIELQGIHTLE